MVARREPQRGAYRDLGAPERPGVPARPAPRSAGGRARATGPRPRRRRWHARACAGGRPSRPPGTASRRVSSAASSVGRRSAPSRSASTTAPTGPGGVSSTDPRVVTSTAGGGGGVCAYPSRTATGDVEARRQFAGRAGRRRRPAGRAGARRRPGRPAAARRLPAAALAQRRTRPSSSDDAQVGQASASPQRPQTRARPSPRRAARTTP